MLASDRSMVVSNRRAIYSCPFPLANLSHEWRMDAWQSGRCQTCLGHFAVCARFAASRVGGPATLYPNWYGGRVSPYSNTSRWVGRLTLALRPSSFLTSTEQAWRKSTRST